MQSMVYIHFTNRALQFVYLYETVCIFVCSYLPLVDSQEQHDVLSALDEEQQEVEHYSSYLNDHLMSQVAIKLSNFI